MVTDAVVQLNVGGTPYTTSLETLTNAEPGSVLHSMFASEFSWTHQLDAAGRVFIDRDGARFRHVLNFLRSGCLHIDPDDETLCTELLEEADYFGIMRLVEALTAVLDMGKERRMAMEAKRVEMEQAAQQRQQQLTLQMQQWRPLVTTTKAVPVSSAGRPPLSLSRTQSEPPTALQWLSALSSPGAMDRSPSAMVRGGANFTGPPPVSPGHGGMGVQQHGVVVSPSNFNREDF